MLVWLLQAPLPPCALLRKERHAADQWVTTVYCQSCKTGVAAVVVRRQSLVRSAAGEGVELMGRRKRVWPVQGRVSLPGGFTGC